MQRFAHALSGTVVSGLNSRRNDAPSTTDMPWPENNGSAGAMSLNSEDMETFQMLSAEMFDPIMFEGLNQSPWDGVPSGNAVWDGFSLGL